MHADTRTMPRRRSPSATAAAPPSDGFGSRLAQLRKQRGLTQVELAERVGISQPLLSYYENESQSVPTWLLAQLAETLDVSLDELVLGKAARSAAKIRRSTRLSRLGKRIREIESLPPADQKAILLVLDGLLARHRLRSA